METRMFSVRLLTLFGCLCGAKSQAPLVTTVYGMVEGLHELDDDGNHYDVFLGIPFAAPPVDNLRWEKPTSLEAWNGVLQTKEHGDACQQLGNPWTSEDCLYINVYIPDSVADHVNDTLPVMVWFYGGGFFFGSTRSYDGTTLATQGRVVFVTFNYRLCVTGFMSTMSDASPGNYGLWDQIAALHWVQDNIAQFGGDPNSVTIVGQSAGAVSVSHMALSTPAQGLFHRVIAMSGSSASYFGLTQLQNVTTSALAKMYGCANDDDFAMVDCMRGKSAWSLNLAGLMVPVLLGYLPNQIPVLDGELVGEMPDVSMMQGVNADYDLMSGRGRDDGSMFSLLCSFSRIILKQALLFMMNVYVNPHELVDMLYERFPDLDSKDKPTRDKAASQVFTDFIFGCRSFFEVEQHYKNSLSTGKSTYFYQFDYQYWFRNTSWVTGMHSEDVKFFFGSSGFTGDDALVSKYIQSYYCNFAYTGNPNEGPHSVPVPWPQYDTSNKQQLMETIDIRSEPISEEVLDRYNWWNDVFFPAIIRYDTYTEHTIATPELQLHELEDTLMRDRLLAKLKQIDVTDYRALQRFAEAIINFKIEDGGNS